MRICDQHRSRTPIAAAVAAVLYVHQGTVARAADTGTEETGLAEVVVTATRRSENIQDIPLNIAAVTSKTIEDLRLDKIDDLTQWVPGVSIKDQGPWGASSVVIRGLILTPSARRAAARTAAAERSPPI